MNYASIFTGLGGFDLAAEWMNWDIKFQCEIDDYMDSTYNRINELQNLLKK